MNNNNHFPQKRVLIIEDRVEFQLALHKIVGVKFDIIFSKNKGSAVDFANKNKLDLIILSSRLQESKTVDVCINLKSAELTRDIPILVIAENGGNIAEYFFQNVEGFLIKPINERELLSHIDGLLNYSQVFENRIKKMNRDFTKTNF